MAPVAIALTLADETFRYDLVAVSIHTEEVEPTVVGPTNEQSLSYAPLKCSLLGALEQAHQSTNTLLSKAKT